MVKIIKKGETPTRRIECSNCGSVLEYDNSDLSEMRNYLPVGTVYGQYIKTYFICPVCGCEVRACWIEPADREMPTDAK